WWRARGDGDGLPLGLLRGLGRGRTAVRVHDDLAGLARLQLREGLLEVRELDLVGDQRPQVDDAALEQPAGLVPGGEDPPAVDGEDVEVLEDQRLGDVDLDRARR